MQTKHRYRPWSECGTENRLCATDPPPPAKEKNEEEDSYEEEVLECALSLEILWLGK